MPPAIALLLVLSATGATRFVWHVDDGAEGCSDGQSVAARVEQRLGRPVFTTGDDAVDELQVRIARRGNRWLGTVALHDSAGALLGERDVQTDKPRCEDLEAALVLIISLTVSPRAAPEPEPPRTPPPELDRKPAVPAPPAPESEPPPPTWRLVPRAWLTAAYGELPSFTAGAQLSLMLQRGEGWQLELGVHGWLPAWLSGGSGRVRLAPLEAGLAVCPLAPRFERLGFAACFEARGGVLWAQGFDFAETFLRTYPLFSAGLSTRLELRLTDRWSLHAALGALVRPYQPDITYVDAEGVRQRITRLPLLQVTGGLGFGATFQ